MVSFFRMKGIRHRALSFLDRRLEGRLPVLDESDWACSAMVVAPHPDDETLGCGGVAAKKLAVGARVHFVFVTDGAASHPALAPAALRAIRQAEATEAVARLGARADNVTFLGIPDGHAAQHAGSIADRLAGLLDAIAPESVFIPHAQDVTPDHVAVNLAVRRALDRRAAPTTVLEYPVWYWYHWPWVGIGGDLPRMWRTALRQTVRARFGLGALRTLNTRAYIGDALPRKRAALAAHASQMQRSAEDWPVLSDVGRGDFLARLLGDHEMFTRYRLHA
jgi:LmbE family N-acetylglucosaminyl deacetylase